MRHLLEQTRTSCRDMLDEYKHLNLAIKLQNEVINTTERL